MVSFKEYNHKFNLVVLTNKTIIVFGAIVRIIRCTGTLVVNFRIVLTWIRFN